MKAYEVKVCVVRECTEETRAISAENIASFWHDEVSKSAWFDSEKEMFVVFILSARNHIKTYNLVSIGLMDASLVHPREVFRAAILDGAVAVIVAHNHPSGDLTPSAEDIHITKQLVEAGKIIQIKVLDHVIIGDKFRYNSIRENGAVNFI